MLDRHDCYELCVQSPRHVVAMLRALHGNHPLTLREDFSGTAAVARRWVAEGATSGTHGEVRTALAVDMDPDVIAAGELRSKADGVSHALRFRRADATGPDAPNDPCDVIFTGNFSIGYLKTRAALVTYLRACLDRLRRGGGGFGGGVLVCDTYGGAGQWRIGGIERRHPSRGREVIRYAWAHESADPLTGLVQNSISFRIERDGDIVQELPRAFVYSWRLWSIADLREALSEAGFSRTAVFKDAKLAPGESPVPVEDPAHLGDDWVVMVVGWESGV